MMVGYRRVACVGLLAVWLSTLASPAAGQRADSAGLQSASGSFVVADTWRSRPDVRPSDAWAHAEGIDITDDGRFFVVDGDPAAPRLTVWHPAGQPITLVAGPPLARPMHVAADVARNRLYVADIGSNALHVFTLAGGKVTTHTGIPGALGVAVGHDGTVYVTASTSGSVHRFDAAGKPLNAWSIVDPVAGGGLLGGADVDRYGRIHILDGRSPRAHVLDINGRSQGDVDLAVDGKPIDLVVDVEPGTGRQAYWLATSNGLRWLKADGGVLTYNTGGLTAVAVAKDMAIVGTTQRASQGVSQVVKLDYEDALNNRAEVMRIGGMLTAAGVLNGPERIEIGADGMVYLLDRLPRIQRFAPDGTPLRQLRLPTILAADAGPDGRVYAVDGDAVRARAFQAPDLDGEVLWDRDVAANNPAAAFLVDLAYDAAGGGSLVALDILDRSIRRFDLSGAALARTPLPWSPDTASGWSDLAIDTAGQVYLLDRTGRRVEVLAVDGSFRSLPMKSPARRIAVANDGRLFALGRDGLVWSYEPAGGLAGVFDAQRPDVTAASRPIDLAIDGVGDILVADRNGDVVTRYTWDNAARPMLPPETDPVCAATPGKTALPSTVRLGEAVDVTLTVRGSCGASVMAPALDVYLILDESGSMLEERRMEIAKQAALDFIHELDLSRSRVGLVTFSHIAKLATSLTSEEGTLWRAINRIEPFGSTAIDLGLKTAREDLLLKRSPDAKAIFILLSDGVSDRAKAIAEADAAKALGVEIFTISVGSDPQLMTDIAAGPSWFFQADDPSLLFKVFDAIIRRILARALFQSIDVVDQIADNMDYVPNSAVPGAPFDPPTRTLRWTLRDVAFGGFQVQFRVIPRQAGDWPVSVGASATYVDGLGRPGRLEFPNPIVRVVAPTATPTATLTPTPSPTRTPAPGRVFLPITLREKCEPGQRTTDVVLVIDTSVSMDGAKFEAAKAAALSFVDTLDLTPNERGQHDQVAVVLFSREARLALALTRDEAAIRAAINGIQLAPGTMIDRGLQLAWDEMRSGRRRAGNTPTVILMTDGIHNGLIDDVYAIGDQVCQAGIRLYTIGLGNDLDIEFLKKLACDDTMAYLAPRPEQLAQIYAEIGGTIPCAPETYWGGR